MTNIFHSQNTNVEEQYFCLAGQEDFLDENGFPRVSNKDDGRVAAKIAMNKRPKQVTANQIYKSYFIKVNPALNVYNPVQHLIFVKDKNTNQFINAVCKNEWTFIEVDINLFNKYLYFLQTGNSKLIKNIERDLK